MATVLRERILESATELILNQGFAATSVDSICERAGASKGSFYHFFKSKGDLGAGVLEAWFERIRVQSERGPYQTEVHPETRLMGFVNHTKNLSPGLWGKGSVLSAVAMELGTSGPAIPEACSRLLEEAHERTAPLFETLASGLDRTPSARELAQLFLAVVEGAALLARAEGKPDLARETLETFQLCIKRLMEYTRESS
jgi:TetR/AcrR family transcriptional repressor of nem operon